MSKKRRGTDPEPFSRSSSASLKRSASEKKYSVRTCILGIVLCGLLAHAVMLNDHFKIMDDLMSIVDNENVHSPSNLPAVFRNSFFGERVYYRPLVSLSYLLEYQIFGPQAFFYYLTNLFLHLAAAAAVFFLAEIFLKKRFAAFLTGLLFAIHPIHWEAVSNISGRAILLAGVFSLNAFLFFCLFDAQKRKFFLGISLAAFSLALLSKESALVFPVLLSLYLILVPAGGESKRSARLKYTLPFWGLTVIYLALRKILGITQIYTWQNAGQAFLGFTTFLRSLLTHLKLFFWPLGLHFDRSRPVFLSWQEPEVFLTWAGFLLALLCLWRLRRNLEPLAQFCIFWFLIDLIPVSQLWVTVGVQPFVISTADHFLYTASAGIFVLLVWAGRRLVQKAEASGVCSPVVCRWAVVGVFAFLFLTTVQQNFYARTGLTMFEQTLKHAPHNRRVRNSLGLTWASYGKFDRAEAEFRKVLAGDPADVLARIGLGKALCDQNRCAEGIAEYEKIPPEAAGRFRRLLEDNLRLSYDITRGNHLNPLPRKTGEAKNKN